MNFKIFLGVISICISSFSFSAEENSTEMSDTQQAEQQKRLLWADNIWNSLDKQTGTINIDEANAVLNVPERFYFLNAKDAQTILVDVWGNPPDQTTLGMLFPIDSTPFHNNAWAVTIEYEENGFVSDEGAADIDYNDLLSQMKDDVSATSQARIEQGYEPIELVGWAAPPFYDAENNKLYWAKELKFGSQSTNTLNYNIRVLGRKGVLVLNFIANIDQKQTIESNIESVLAIAHFDQGSKYSDFNPDIDDVAAYGLGALVAGKIIAKTGFLAVALVFLKKFGIFIIFGVGALIKGLSSKKTTPADS